MGHVKNKPKNTNVPINFPNTRVKPTAGGIGSDTDPIHPRVTFTPYSWKNAKPQLENTKITKGEPGTSITLCVPANFTEDLKAEWEMQEASVVVAQLGKESLGQAGSNALSDSIRKGESMFKDAGGDTIINGFKFFSGTTSFPGEFLTFAKASPIELSFTFELVPRNSGDAEAIQKITQTFKKKLPPKFGGPSSGNFYLQYPDIWTISFSGLKGVGHPDPVFEGRYEAMALVDVGVTYLGGQSSALTYNDGHPIGIQLKLSFKSVKHTYIKG